MKVKYIAGATIYYQDINLIQIFNDDGTESFKVEIFNADTCNPNDTTYIENYASTKEEAIKKFSERYKRDGLCIHDD